MNKIFNDNGNNITFKIGNGDVMVTAIEMAKVFSKKPDDNLRSLQTIELIEALSAKRKCETPDVGKV